MRKLATFLAWAAGGAVICALTVTLTFDFLTADTRKVPFSYPQFLLENIEAPRIVIDAGSSSMFGIEPELIEHSFRTPVIDVADNGSIPLDLKIYRILKYAQPGDTLILPLEWVYYSRTMVPQDFTDKTPNEYAAYYASQPFLQRLLFSIEHLSLHNMSDASRLYLRENLQATNAQQIRDEMAKWPWGDRKDDHRRRSSVEGISCNTYIEANAKVDPLVTWAAEQLAKLQRTRNVSVYLTWPSVAGDDCYKLVNNRRPLADAARKIFEAHGIKVIGEPQDSLFTPEHMLDTYYHIDSRAARTRTERLVGRLLDAGLKPGDAATKGTPKLAKEALRAFNARNPHLTATATGE